MYVIQRSVNVWLEFRSMPGPVEIEVPWGVLRYLDQHALRRLDSDGTVIYSHPQYAPRGRAPSAGKFAAERHAIAI